MKTMYGSLREKDRRRYAAVEATKLGHGAGRARDTRSDSDDSIPPPGHGTWTVAAPSRADGTASTNEQVKSRRWLCHVLTICRAIPVDQ